MTDPALVQAPPRRMMLAFQVAFFAISLNLVIIAPLLPQLAATFQRPVGDLGLLVTAFALPYAIVAPLLGPVSERLGRKALIVSGMVLFVLGQLAAVLAPTLDLLMLARTLTGLGAAAFTPAAYAYIGDHVAPARRAAAIGTALIAATLGSIFGLPLGGLAVFLAGWQGAFAMLGAMGLLAAVLLFLWLGHDRPLALGRRYVTDLAEALTAPGARLTLLVTVLWSAGYNGGLAFTGALMGERYGLASDQIAVMLGGLGLGGLLGNRVGAWLGPRHGDRRMLLGAIVCLLVAVAGLPTITPSPWVTVAFASLLPGAVQLGWPPLLAIVSELAPRSRATALALNNSAYYLGGALGPPLAGRAVVAGGIGWLGAPGLVAGGLALVLALYGVGRRARPRLG